MYFLMGIFSCFWLMEQLKCNFKEYLVHQMSTINLHFFKGWFFFVCKINSNIFVYWDRSWKLKLKPSKKSEFVESGLDFDMWWTYRIWTHFSVLRNWFISDSLCCRCHTPSFKVDDSHLKQFLSCPSLTKNRNSVSESCSPLLILLANT